jgi:predicted GTPase
LQPFDLHEYEKLVREGFKAAEQVKGKTLVLLLGATGAGKSTTTHYLCGSTMKQEGHYFNPVEIRNKVLKENPDLIATSHVGGQSCTRYVAAVPVHLKNDHHLEIDAELLLMDAPGYGDLAGAEVDISNSQSIVEAVSHAKEVRLLILVSKMGLKDRIEGEDVDFQRFFFSPFDSLFRPGSNVQSHRKHDQQCGRSFAIDVVRPH